VAHTPDGHDPTQLIADAQRLVAQSRAHEQRLWSAVTSLEGGGGLAASRTANPTAVEVLAFVRDLCVAARDQRQQIEHLVTRMLGNAVVPNADQVRVLVVDDSDDIRELAAIVLEAAGFHVIMARNGLEGVVAAHCQQPSVVLMDVAMPVLNGIEAARLIKASAGTRHLKILAHTARPELYEGPMTQLFVDVLKKPTTPEALVVAVRRFVEAAPAGD
jgi:CheY-like chemotaxis protein